MECVRQRTTRGPEVLLITDASNTHTYTHTHAHTIGGWPQENYRSRDGKEATFYVATASSGAGVIPVEQLARILHGLEQPEEGAGFSLRRHLGGLLVPVGVALAAALLIYLIGLKQ